MALKALAIWPTSSPQDNGTRAERSPVFSTCNMTSLRVLSWLSRKRISNCEAQSMASIRISTHTA
ncbi:hypothetical protein D3C76_1810010 [compost metagenome]